VKAVEGESVLVLAGRVRGKSESSLGSASANVHDFVPSSSATCCFVCTASTCSRAMLIVR
jgi:hypothetical protein